MPNIRDFRKVFENTLCFLFPSHLATISGTFTSEKKAGMGLFWRNSRAIVKEKNVSFSHARGIKFREKNHFKEGSCFGEFQMEIHLMVATDQFHSTQTWFRRTAIVLTKVTCDPHGSALVRSGVLRKTLIFSPSSGPSPSISPSPHQSPSMFAFFDRSDGSFFEWVEWKMTVIWHLVCRVQQRHAYPFPLASTPNAQAPTEVHLH